MTFFSYERILRGVLSWKQAAVFSLLLCIFCMSILVSLAHVCSLNLHMSIAAFVLVPLGIAAFIDSVLHILPDPLLLFAAIIALLALLFTPWNAIGQATISAGIFLALGLLMSRFSSFGRGDAKLMGVLGLWLGSPLAVFVALILAFTGAALFALALLTTKRALWTSSIALGPWLVAGGFLSYLLVCIGA